MHCTIVQHQRSMSIRRLNFLISSDSTAALIFRRAHTIVQATAFPLNRAQPLSELQQSLGFRLSAATMDCQAKCRRIKQEQCTRDLRILKSKKSKSEMMRLKSRESIEELTCDFRKTLGSQMMSAACLKRHIGPAIRIQEVITLFMRIT